MKRQELVTMYTDGSCHGNPGPGGYAAILMCGSRTVEVHGCEWYTTGERMEIRAVVEGLKMLERTKRAHILSDNRTVTAAISSGRAIYLSKNARHNRDLWGDLVRQLRLHPGSYADWVKGHADSFYNNRCDLMANIEADRVRKETDIAQYVFTMLRADRTISPERLKEGCRKEWGINAIRRYHTLYFEMLEAGYDDSVF